MLQRIQTVFLILVALFMLLTFFFPIWTLRSEDGELLYQLTVLELTKPGEGLDTSTTIFYPYTLIATLVVAAITVAIVEITKFKNRLLQMKLGALNALFMAGALALSVYFATDLIKTSGGSGNFGIGLFLPGIAMMFNILANRFIRRDDRLVKSVDRIR